MDFKKIISTILLIIWMVVIFLFSNEDATISQSKSDVIAKTTINTVSNITGKNYTNKEKNDFVVNSRFIIRKTAHFILYFVLGVLVYITFKSYNINKNIVLYSILLCFIYAISDEFHQIFRNGRTFKVIDIAIDTMASSVSSSLIYIIDKKTCFFNKKMV